METSYCWSSIILITSWHCSSHVHLLSFGNILLVNEPESCWNDHDGQQETLALKTVQALIIFLWFACNRAYYRGGSHCCCAVTFSSHALKTNKSNHNMHISKQQIQEPLQNCVHTMNVNIQIEFQESSLRLETKADVANTFSNYLLEFGWCTKPSPWCWEKEMFTWRHNSVEPTMAQRAKNYRRKSY